MRKIIWISLILFMMSLSVLFLGWSGLLKPMKLNTEQIGSSFPHLRSLVLNRKGNAMFLVQNYGAAFDSYVQTLEYDPFSAETHLDLGLTYELQQQMDKAPLSYENAYKFAKNDDLRFMSLFNLAQLQGKAKKVDEAIDLYQKSLTIRPDSLEAKTNIELLIQSQQQQGKNGDKKDDQKKDDKENKDDKKDDKKDGKDPKDDKDKKDGKDGDKDPKDPKDDKKDPKDGKDKNEDKKYGGNPKPQPKKFDSKDLSEGDVKKILQELKQQEQKIRAEFNRKEVKEQPRDKDW